MAALSRLQARIRENFHETTRDITLLTTGSTSSSAKYFDSSTSEEKLKEISKLLDSRLEQERLEGMKRIIAGMSKGRDMESFFAVVVKNVGAQSLEIRKLVYIYLLRFASTNSDLLLLSINTFQKDLSDPSPLIRSMSLRVLTSIRVPVIQGIVMLGLKKLVNDRNPWVRKTVAGGLAKVYSIDTSSLSQIIPLLQTLLASQSPLTLGATLTAFSEICPDRLDLLHPYYRHICRLLVDADEWGQIVALQVLSRYARAMLEKPEPRSSSNAQQGTTTKSKVPTQSEEESDDEFAGLDIDLAMLLHCSKPLFQSRNPAVVVAAAVTYYHLAPAGHQAVGQELLVSPLLKLAATADEQSVGGKGEEIALMTWEVLCAMVDERPWLFNGRFSSFLLHNSESSVIQILKLRALAKLVSSKNVKTFLRECKQYIRLPNDEVAEEAVRAIGHCVKTHPESVQLGINVLMRLLKSPRNALVAQSVIVLKSVILALPPSMAGVTTSENTIDSQRLVARLGKGLDSITHPKARASIFWLVGQFAASDGVAEGGLGWDGMLPWIPDVLRKGVKDFVNESDIVKLQILTLVAKLLVLSPSTGRLHLITRYLFTLARYDSNYDVRDRARFLHALLRGIRAEQKASNQAVNGDTDEADEGVEDAEEEEDIGGVVLRREQVRVILFAKGDDVGNQSKLATSSDYDVGSLSRIVGRRMAGYESLPEWTDDPTDSSLRESEIGHSQPETSNYANNPPPPVSSVSNPVQVQPPPQAVPRIPSPNLTPPRSTEGSSPSSLPLQTGSYSQQPAKTKFKDLDKFLDSESETEDEDDDDSDDQSDTSRHAPLTAPPRSAIVPEYDEDESESGNDEVSDGESDSDEDRAESRPLYDRHR